MNENIVTISVGGNKVGLIGIPEILEEVKSIELASDAEIKKFLLKKVKAQNYIPPGKENDYGLAILKLYQKSIGLPVVETEGSPSWISIKVLGPGCYSCEQLEKDVRAILTELNITADIEHVRDLNEIASYGMIATPALVVNNEIILAGRILPRAKLAKLLESKLAKNRD